MSRTIEAYIETGSKRVFAGALAWPGWCRSGRDADAAVQALVDYAPRYASVLRGKVRGFDPRVTVVTVEKIKGDATTDFGAPGAAPRADADPIDARELARQKAILRACWAAFDAAVAAAEGVTLQKGPRGGGRDLGKIVAHVLDAQRAYASQLGGRAPSSTAPAVHDAFLDALDARVAGEVADRGPRGGVRWSPRYAIRRAAWHVLDHAWEIEDRAGHP